MPFDHISAATARDVLEGIALLYAIDDHYAILSAACQICVAEHSHFAEEELSTLVTIMKRLPVDD